MRQTLVPAHQLPADDNRPRAWAPLLPGLCCQAAGGQFEWSESIAAAWTLYQIAADLLDQVADNDEPEPWRTSWDVGKTINVATGLIFSASWALNTLYKEPIGHETAADIILNFHRHLFTITSGQHLDLLEKKPTTEIWSRVASAKAGAPFALACWSGARLAVQESAPLDAFWNFGHHLGYLVQILDDARDFLPTPTARDRSDRTNLSPWSLPVAYAMEVLPPARRAELEAYLTTPDNQTANFEIILEIIELSGASLYVETLLNYHQQQALHSLDLAASSGVHKDQLKSIVVRLLEP